MSEWWDGHGFPAVPLEILPRLGIIAEINGSPIGAAWLYMDNSSGVCMMEWTVTNPANNPRDSLRAISALTEFLKADAKSNGYTVILTTCKQQSLARVHERNGFTKTDDGMIHLIGGLK